MAIPMPSDRNLRLNLRAVESAGHEAGHRIALFPPPALFPPALWAHLPASRAIEAVEARGYGFRWNTISIISRFLNRREQTRR